MSSPPIAAIGALIGDPARALMLAALMDGRARTASELASEAGITRQTTSAHLARLTDGGLLAVVSQGRHRYFRLSSPEVAEVLESLMALGGRRSPAPVHRPRSPEREARTCYDHLAGRLGVMLLDSLDSRGYLHIAGSELTLSSPGRSFVAALNIDVHDLERKRRSFARLCLDWSERRNHLGGALGAALLDRFLADGWIRRGHDSRAVSVTQKGGRALTEVFGISFQSGRP